MSHFKQFSSTFLLRTSDEQTNSETRIYTITENCSYVYEVNEVIGFECHTHWPQHAESHSDPMEV